MNRFFYTAPDMTDIFEDLLSLAGLKKEDILDPQTTMMLRTAVSDNEKAYEVLVEAPGATQDMIEVQFKDDTVSVKVDYGTEGKLRRGKYAWAKKFKDVDGAAIEAKLDGGMLNLTIPKRPESQPQKIKIN